MRVEPAVPSCSTTARTCAGVRYGGLVAGPARTDGKVVLERWVELQSVSVKSSAFDVDAMTVTTPSMVIPIAENVMCYNETTGSWYQVPDEARRRTMSTP